MSTQSFDGWGKFISSVSFSGWRQQNSNAEIVLLQLPADSSYETQFWQEIMQISEGRALEGCCSEWTFLMKTWDGGVNCGCDVCKSESSCGQPLTQVENIFTYLQMTK